MKRSLLLWIILLTVSAVRGQLYTGGQGDGATMSCVPPKVSTLGQTDITCVSNEIVLSVYASGTDLQYVWQKFANNFYEDLLPSPHLTGLGTDTLRILLPDKIRDDGKYRCLVKNTCDSDTSETFVLNINWVPVVDLRMSTSEQAQFACANMYPFIDLISNISSPQKDHHYSWVKIDSVSGVRNPLPDTTSFLKVNLSGAALDAGGLYVVTAANACGVISDSVFLPVFRAPAVVWNDVVNNRIATCLGERLRLSATVSGGGRNRYFLERVAYNELLGEWIPTNNTEYPQPVKERGSIVASDEGYWRWRVENQCGSTYSDIVRITVEGSPSFAPNMPDTYVFPQDTTVCEGGSIKLMCKASGTATRYYWLKDGKRVEGCDTNVLELTNLKEADAGKYVCYAYNHCMRTVNAPAITLSLSLRPRFLRDPYLPKKACVGDTLILFRTTMDPDHDADSLRWMFNDQLVYDNDHYEGSDNKDFYVHNVGDKDLGIYQVMAYNKCGATVSEIAKLFDLSVPVSFQKGVGGYDALLCPGVEQKLSVSVSGSAPVHYKWIFNEHSYETDTNFVTVKGQSVSEKNKYTVYAYNACGSAIDTGWLKVERFDHFNFIGHGEVCEGAEPTGYLELQGSDRELIYTLYREYGVAVKTFNGTGDTVRFFDMPAGVYYVIAKNPKTECEQEMNGRPEIKKLKAPSAANFYVESFYCPGSANNGAKLVLTDWENGVTYALERRTGANWVSDANRTFTGGVRIYPVGSLRNSPLPGEPQVYSNVDFGRYRVIATNPSSINRCSTTMLLADSIYLLESPSIHILAASHNDTVNCLRTVNGLPHVEMATLEVDRFMKGATYTLYKNGVPDPDHEPDKTSPISWSQIGEGTYQVRIKTREGCEGNTKNTVHIKDVKAPDYQTLSGSGSLCADLDTEINFKELTIDKTEIGVDYYVYQQEPSRLIKKVAGTGNAVSVRVQPKKITYYVVASDASGMCQTTFEKEYTMLASDFQVSMNPADVFLDGKGKTTWLHVDINGSYVQPLDVKWEDEAQLQKTGLVSLPNVQYYKHYHWPFCPCADAHDYFGGTTWHNHGPSCTMTNCPFLYHSYSPAKNGCTLVGTEYKTYSTDGGTTRGPWYDLYFCKEGANPDASENYYVNDTTNPFRNRLTTPVNEDRVYTVTATDGAGCVHKDEVTVRVLGGRLRTEIMYSEIHKHYEYPFCPCHAQHRYHRCSPSCNDNNCPVLYHGHKHQGCTWTRSETIEYRGSRVKHFDEYFCCTNNEANDTIVYRNDNLYFCSETKGGDYNYVKKWSFSVPGDNTASWTGKTGDTVRFAATESGWLRNQVTSMGQEATDSIWIEVLRRPFIVEIQDGDGHRLDTLDICKGDEIRLYGHSTSGDGETIMQWWGDGYEAPSDRWWVFQPVATGNFIFTAKNDGITRKDTVYIRVYDRPAKPVVVNAGKRCVLPGRVEKIRVEAPTVVGSDYVLEYSADKGVTYIEYDRINRAQGNPIEFRVTTPVRDSGIYRVRVAGLAGSHTCDSYSELIEFITPPSHDEIVSTNYCRDEQLTIRLRSTGQNMSYSILNSVNKSMETINSPLDFFNKTFVAGNYKIVYTHNGVNHACSDTVDFQIKQVPPARLVDVLVNNGNGACEGMNAVISIPNSENLVHYYLEAPSGEKLELFTGTGNLESANIGSRAYGTYRVMAEQNGCATFIDNFTFNRNPKPLEQNSIHYCYPYGGASTMAGAKLEYNNLESGVTYSLFREGALSQTIEGPGTKSFDNVHNGNYTIIAKNDETGCMDETSFKIEARETPKDFILRANCEKDKNITLVNSQPGFKYILYRDTIMLDTLLGNGSPLEFGVYNTTGVYKVMGIDTVYGCSAVMNGEIVINEVGHCDLVQETEICNIRGTTALVYPCSKKGWVYYIKDETDPANILSSTSQPGTGVTIRWESMGTTADLFGPKVISPTVWKPSVYVLYGKDVCGDIPLDTISISVKEPPTAKIETRGTVLKTSVRNPSATLSVCPNESLDFFLSEAKENVRCILVATSSVNYKDTLLDFITTAAHLGRKNIGSFGIKDRRVFEFSVLDGACSSKAIFNVVPRTLPDKINLEGNSVCEGTEPLEIKLQGTAPAGSNYNYYLMREGTPVALDTILYSDTNPAFKAQTDPGRYYVVIENIELAAGNRYTRICQDTALNTFAIGDAPTRFHVVSLPDRGKEIYLCTGALGKIELVQTENTVDYALMRNGVEYSERQHKANGGLLEFGVHEAGEYTVTGFLGNCEVSMLDTVMVYEDVFPDLELYDTYYFCRDEDGGAVVEVFDAPMLTTFELRAAGPYSDLIEADTVHFRGDTISFAYKCPLGDKYVLTIRTRGGCQFDHFFEVKKMTPPDSLSLIMTADAICEGDCTSIGIMGDEGNIEYTLLRKDVSGDVQNSDNFVMGFGGRDTLWFPYPVCETGVYYVTAIQYTRPYCETTLKYKGQNLISLLEIDSIRECNFFEKEVHYCGGNGSTASISIQNAQLGIQYTLYEGDSIARRDDAVQTATVEGETLTWNNVVAREACSNENEKFTSYNVRALNTQTNCSKWMNGPVKVYQDGYINTLAITQTNYEFCEGGDLMLKVRAEGCGLMYEWNHVTTLGTNVAVGNSQDILLKAATSDMSGSYYCNISNACGTHKTAPYIEVEVRPNGSKTKMGREQICEGEPYMLYSEMKEVNEGDYAWYKKGENKILSRNSYLKFDSVTSDAEGFYVCVGGDMDEGYCNVLYDTVYIEVVKNVNNLNIVQGFDSLCVGSALKLTIPEQIPGGYQVLWYLNGMSTSIVGMEYYKPNVHRSDAGLYSIELKHSSGVTCGRLGMAPVSKVRVDSIIQELWHSEDKYLCQPENILLSVRTSPSTGVKYDWYKIVSPNPEEYIGSGADFVTQFPKGTDHATYRVYYHNTCPADYWTTLNIADVDVTLASHISFKKNLPSEITGCEGDMADTTLTVAIDGTTVHGDVWTFTSAATGVTDTVARGTMGLVNAGEASYTIPYLHERSGFYTCILKTDCGRLVSQACWVRVNTPAAITADLVANSGKMCEGSYFTPTLTATGSDLQFRWFITYPDGRVDTVGKAIGYAWESTDQLSLLTETKYAGAKLQCVVWNACGKALSSPVELEIVSKRDIAVSPAETWLCCDSTAKVEVKLLNGDGGDWSYQWKRDDYSPSAPRPVIAGRDKDTLLALVSGKYAIVGLNDHICDYKDQVMAEFNIYDLPRPTVNFSMASGKRDTTLCAGKELPMMITITGGTGPYEVSVYYQEDTMPKPKIYNLWMGSNPFIVSADMAARGYELNMQILKEARYSIKVFDISNGLVTGDGCPVEIPAGQEIDVRTVERVNVKLDQLSSLIFGECELDVDLRACLHPSPTGGTFHLQKQLPGTAGFAPAIDRSWEYAHILKSDGPGIYKINYSLNGVCKETSNNFLTVVIDSLPYAHITPIDTMLCCGSASPNLQVFLHGAAPFDSLRIETSRMKDNGSTSSSGTYYTTMSRPPLGTPYNLPFSMMPDCSDSLARYTATYLKDGHGCVMAAARQPEALVSIRKLPVMKIAGYHKSYNNGLGDESTMTYSVNTGDSVAFKISLIGCKRPWTVSFAHLTTPPPAIPDEQKVYTVYGTDTVITVKKEGYYVFDAAEAGGCAQAGSEVVRQIRLAPPGYVTIKGLYLGGALCQLLNTSPVNFNYVRMTSALPRDPSFPNYGYDLTKFNLYMNSPLPVIDWVFVEARKLDAGTGVWSVIDRDSCLLLANGDVVDRDFNRNLKFEGTGVAGEMFYVAVFHRNHLPVMTVRAQSFNPNGVGTSIQFGYAGNYYWRKGALNQHVWNFWTYSGQELMVMAPSYKQINNTDHLVSMSNPAASYFELDASGMMGIIPGYYLWDVTFNGFVEIPPILTDFTRLPTMGTNEDAWMLYQNRDRYSEIEEF